jgi:hypothetical protein
MSKWLTLAQQQIGRGASKPSAACAAKASDSVPIVPLVPKGRDRGAIGTIGTASETAGDLTERRGLFEEALARQYLQTGRRGVDTLNQLGSILASQVSVSSHRLMRPMLQLSSG